MPSNSKTAFVQVFYRLASVYDAESMAPLFLVDLNLPGGAGRIQRGCQRRLYEVPQVHTNARGVLRLRKRPPGVRCVARSDRPPGPANPWPTIGCAGSL